MKTPVKDAQGQPVGGVRFPELDYPLGRLEPPSLSPCDLASINSLCGNFGGFAPFASGAIAARYWSADRYVAQVRASLVRLAAAGYLLERDLPAMLQAARAAYEAAA